MPKESHVRWFENIRLKDIPAVGGKTALLGELYALLAADGGRVPDGFALTAGAYREVLAAAGAVDKLRRLLADLDHHDVSGHPTPLDIEWAKDGEDGRLCIVQARPETVASPRAPDAFETYSLKGAGALLATGRAAGEKIASGKVRMVADAHDLTVFQPGEVLVAEATSPDWEPVIKTAAAIVTSHRGGFVTATMTSAH